jgi:RecB family endonuclease NucS
MARLKADVSERAFLDALRAHLAESRWEVQDDPVFGSVRPDLVIRDPAGHVTVAEVKFGEGAAHFGSIAQVASYATLVAEILGDEVRGVLVTDQVLPPGVADAAKKLGVDVVNWDARMPPWRAAEGSTFNFLRDLGDLDAE